jgi:hypothetical protein
MSATTVRTVLALVWLLTIAAVAGTQQQPSRLLVVNDTRTTVEVSVRVRDAWQSRGRVSPGSSLPVYNVTDNQLVRAVWNGGSKERPVKLRYDRSYGGWQDVLRVP